MHLPFFIVARLCFKLDLGQTGCGEPSAWQPAPEQVFTSATSENRAAGDQGHLQECCLPLTQVEAARPLPGLLGFGERPDQQLMRQISIIPMNGSPAEHYLIRIAQDDCHFFQLFGASHNDQAHTTFCEQGHAQKTMLCIWCVGSMWLQTSNPFALLPVRSTVTGTHNCANRTINSPKNAKQLFQNVTLYFQARGWLICSL